MATYTYYTLNYPTAAATLASGINNEGQVVGYYNDQSGYHGFLYSGGSYISLDDPSANPSGNTQAFGINDLGQVVGYYRDGNAYHGFLYSNGNYTTIDYPSTATLGQALVTQTFASGINNSSQIVGYYVDTSGGPHAFVDNGGVYTTIDFGFPAAEAYGINNAGQVVGAYYDTVNGGEHGFLYKLTGGSGPLILNDPLAGPKGTAATSINDSGQIAGYYFDNNNNEHGFLYNGGVFTTVDDLLGTVSGTFAFGINNKGQIVGEYSDGIAHGFVADSNPVMSDAVKAHGSLTTLSGTSVGDGTVSVYDGSKLIGTTTAASDGTWSLQVPVKSGAIHSFTEKATDLQGNAASSAGVTLYSTSQNKSLIGNGDDVLIGAPGDKLTGGAGADTFVFNPKLGKETVTDFNVSQDVLAFDHSLFANQPRVPYSAVVRRRDLATYSGLKASCCRPGHIAGGSSTDRRPLSHS